MPVLKAVATTLAFIAQHVLDLLVILWLPFVLMTVGIWLVTPSYVAAQMAVMSADPETALPLMATMFGYMAVTLAISAIFYSIMLSGVARLVLRGEKPTLPFYLALGADDLRVLGTVLLLGLCFAGVQIAGGVLGFLGGLLMGLGPGPGVVIRILVAAATLGTMIWLGVRLSLAPPAAVAKRGIGIAPSWEATDEKLWPLLGFYLSFGVVFIIAYLVLMPVMMPEYSRLMGSMFAITDPAQAQEISGQMMQSVIDLYDLSNTANYVPLAVSFALSLVSTLVVTTMLPVAWRFVAEEGSSGGAS